MGPHLPSLDELFNLEQQPSRQRFIFKCFFLYFRGMFLKYYYVIDFVDILLLLENLGGPIKDKYNIWAYILVQ